MSKNNDKLNEEIKVKERKMNRLGMFMNIWFDEYNALEEKAEGARIQLDELEKDIEFLNSLKD